MFNRPDVVQGQIEQDVYDLENPWMVNSNFEEELLGNPLRNQVMMDWFRNEQHAEQIERWLRDVFGPGTGPSHSALGSDQSTPRPTYAVPSNPQQMTPRQHAPPRSSQAHDGPPQQAWGQDYRQAPGPSGQLSGSGLPAPNHVPAHLLPLLIPQVAVPFLPGMPWAPGQQGQVRRISQHWRRQRQSHQYQPSGSQQQPLFQQHRGSTPFGAVGRGRGQHGQVSNDMFHPGPHHTSSHRRQHWETEQPVVSHQQRGGFTASGRGRGGQQRGQVRHDSFNPGPRQSPSNYYQPSGMQHPNAPQLGQGGTTMPGLAVRGRGQQQQQGQVSHDSFNRLPRQHPNAPQQGQGGAAMPGLVIRGRGQQQRGQVSNNTLHASL
ncbi:MAG: hypothetical protein LQ338_002691 [Usnochroma carphineum]|nr:MAG: hypothetical protein LQ338_002691 [Usnochroma carphineum]